MSRTITEIQHSLQLPLGGLEIVWLSPPGDKPGTIRARLVNPRGTTTYDSLPALLRTTSAAGIDLVPVIARHPRAFAWFIGWAELDMRPLEHPVVLDRDIERRFMVELPRDAPRVEGHQLRFVAFRSLLIAELEVWQIRVDLRDGTHTRAIVPIRHGPHIRVTVPRMRR